MKILYDYQILWLQKYGGISRYFYELFHRLSASGKDICIDLPIVSGQNYYFQDTLHYHNWSFRPLERIANELITSWKIIGSYLKKEPYQIIHLTFYLPLFFHWFIQPQKTKIVVNLHDMTPEKYITNDKRLISGKRKWLNRADGIISGSQHAQADMLELYPQLSSKKINVIYHGNSVDVTPEQVSVPSLYLLFVGNRNGYKNFEILLHALSLEPCRRISFSLICAGGGEFTVEEQCAIHQAGLTGRVFQMNVSDAQLAYLYQNARCMVFPSLYEGFGIPILEAYYWRCPLLLTRCSCFPEIAADAALYFDAENAEDLSQKIFTLQQDEVLRERLIQRGIVRLSAFTWETAAEKTLTFYSELLQNA